MRSMSEGQDQLSLSAVPEQIIVLESQNNQIVPSSNPSSSNSGDKGISPGSILSWKSKLSMNRKIKLEALQLEYNLYLKIFHGIFVIRCQMMNIEHLKIKSKIKLNQMLEDVKNFKRT